MPSRPNILLLLSDQQRADALGAVNDAIQTPHLDRLAREGTLFNRAFAPTPVCLPCRASLLSGRYPSTHGAAHNGAGLPEDYPQLLSSALADRGYYTHMIGKSHLTPCHDPLSKESSPFIHNRAYFRNWHGPWYGFEHADIAIGHSTEKHACGMHYGAWLEDRGVDTSRYFGHTAYEEFGAWDLPEEFHNSAWTAETTINGIRRAADSDQPFFIWANFQDPHNPCMVPEPWASMYDPKRIPQHGFKPGEPECFADKPAFYREILDQPGPYACKPSDRGMRGAGNVCHLDWTQEQIQENAACYYGMVSLMDKQIGRILAELDRTGAADNTLVVFASDHGDLLGDHGLWWKSLVCYDESIRVPMIARFPGQIPAGRRSGAFQSLVDLFPTFCNFAGAAAPGEVEGVDQRAVWQGTAEQARADVIIEERPYNSDFNERIIVTDRFKLAYYAGRPWGELYDVQADPHHIRNLWDAPEHRGTRDALVRRILDHEMNKHRPRQSPTAF